MNVGKKEIRVAVVGSNQSGKSALTGCLLERARALALSFISIHEEHDLDALHGGVYDVVLQVVDCTDLEESLMLTPHIIDERQKMILAFNRYDLLLQTHHVLKLQELSHLMGLPMQLVSVPIKMGIDALLEQIQEVAERTATNAHPVFHAWEQAPEDAYRAYIHGVLHQTLVHPDDDVHSWRDKLDAVLTNKWTGFPILVLLLFAIFSLTFLIGEPLQNAMQYGIDTLYDWCISTWPANGLTSLIADGVILGVGSLLTALPNIIILFFFLSVMEDSGYMSRVAFLMDGCMHMVGLHGRSFIPMLMGFDCNVPAIMAAKDIQNPKHRALTMLMVPFMSCSARLPVYILFIGVFFPHYKALVLLSLYMLGVGISFVFAVIMKRTKWFSQPDSDSVNELPALRFPAVDSIWRHIWYRVKDFLQKISTVVLCASVIIWALEYFPAGDLNHIETSYLAMIGHWMEPIMSPLGMDWKMSICLLTGLPAKEAIASTLAILFGGDLTRAAFTPVSAYVFLVFVLLYFPCVATVSTLRKELGWRWAAFTVVNSLAVAWMAAWVIRMIGEGICSGI